MLELWKKQKVEGWRRADLESEQGISMEEIRKKHERERLETGPGMEGILSP